MHGLGERPALADDHDVSLLDGEGRRAVHGDVPVPLLVPVVLGHIVEIVAPHHDGSLHLGGNGDALEDLAADGDVAGEGAFLVDVAGLDGLLGGLEAKAHILEVPDAGRGLLGEELLAVEEDVFLLLEGSLVLR